MLMIISQIMLTGLLVQWLRSQWEEEKQAFQKDLNQKFMESVNQVMDTMLVKHLIVPVMNDTSVNKDHLVRFNRKLRGDINREGHLTAFFNDSAGEKHTVVTITMPDSGGSESGKNVVFSSFDSTRKNLLLRSVKLIIQETGDSVGTGKRMSHMISIIPDTNLLKTLFERKLGDEKLHYNILWIPDTGKNIPIIRSPVISLSTNIFEKPLHMEVLNYQGMIIGRISSQILFAFTLLVLTGAAFFFTYRSLRKQEMLNILRNDFISNISHELKTPVATVSIALEALKSFDRINDPAKANEYLGIASGEMKRLDQLISQVLNTSMLEDHGEYLRFENTDLVSLTEEVLSSLQGRFEQCGASVRFSHDRESVVVSLDRLYIHGVLINLLDNSLKYCSGKPEVKITIEEKPSSVILTIGDNGPGIPEEYLSKIFDKFFRVPRGDTHDIKGYGLGLSFAELVMKHHSGKISVKNKNEGGCEFALTFQK
jgi:signal transduction histidine kinase